MRDLEKKFVQTMLEKAKSDSNAKPQSNNDVDRDEVKKLTESIRERLRRS